MSTEQCYVSPIKIIRNTTISGNPCKQTFQVIEWLSIPGDPLLRITKYILFDEPQKGGYLAKIYKGKYLYHFTFSIRLSTLNDVALWLHNMM